MVPSREATRRHPLSDFGSARYARGADGAWVHEMSWGLTRAKSGRLRVKKRDKSGREYIGQNEVVISDGMHSAREMERELQHAADESREEVVGLQVDVYGSRETPTIETPTRIHGSQTQWSGFQAAAWLPESPALRRMNRAEAGGDG